MSACQACGADLLWARTSKGKAMPVDADPAPNGNVQLYTDNAGLQAKVLCGEKLRLARLGGAQLHLAHFVTCPSAGEFRRR